MQEVFEVLKEHSYTLDTGWKSAMDYQIMSMFNIPQKPKLEESKKLPIFVSESWRSGGLTGGNCWGDVADRSVDPDEEAQFEELDKFLEEHYPNLSFIKYRKLREYIHVAEYSQGEYYGNYNEYRFKYILHEDLINFLQDL